MIINDMNFTIGADPEVFLTDGKNFVSAHDKLPGTKCTPHPVNKGAVQVDGLAAEFNIEPANDLSEFKSNLKTVSNILLDMCNGYSFLENPSVHFDEEFVKGLPKFSLELGCMADYDGWTQSQTPPPDNSALMRTAGGHIHLGGFESEDEYHPIHFQDCAKLARILDEELGVYSVLWDTDDERRKMYGKAGSFRPKKYGMEYRTLSNMWLFQDRLVEFVYNAVESAIKKMFVVGYEPDPVVRDIINNSDRDHIFFKNNPKVKGLVNC